MTRPDEVVVSDEEVDAALEEMWPDVTPEKVRAMLQRRIAARVPHVKVRAVGIPSAGAEVIETYNMGFNACHAAVLRGPG